MSNPTVEILKDFVEKTSSRSHDEGLAADDIKAIEEAQAHAKSAETESLEEIERRGDGSWEENGRKHIPGALHRKLKAINFTIRMAAAEGLKEGPYSNEHTFDLGGDSGLSALVSIGGSIDEVGTTMSQQMGLTVVADELQLPIGYLRDTKYPNYLQLNSTVGSDFNSACDIPIRGDHIEMDPNTGRIQGFREGLHESAAAAMSVVDLIKVDERAIEFTPSHWGPLEVVQ